MWGDFRLVFGAAAFGADTFVFGRDNDRKWLNALRKIGVDPSLLSSTAGHA